MRHGVTDVREGIKGEMVKHTIQTSGSRFHVPVLLAIVGAMVLLVLAGTALAAADEQR